MYIRNFIHIEQLESGQIYGDNFLGGNFTGGGEIWEVNFEKKKKTTIFHPKMNTCMKFHPNQKMGKWSNLGGKFSGGEFHRGGGNLGGEF